jgi:hypothetical protein
MTAAACWMVLPSIGSVGDMASPIPNPNRDFVLGVVYAAIELDDVLNRENGMFGDCEIVRRPDGKANVIYRATFPLPTRTQEARRPRRPRVTQLPQEQPEWPVFRPCNTPDGRKSHGASSHAA